MFANYIKTALRALLKYKGTTLINVLGLTIGLLSVLMISIYVHSEISYDKFHENADRIYRIGVVGKMQGNDLNMAVTSALMARTLVDEYPEVEEAVRIYKSGSHMISYENTTFNEESGKLLFVDSTFFKVFSFKLLQGNPDNALNDPNTIILTKKAAKRYFGDVNPMGKSLSIDSDESNYRITGIVEDPPVSSHFHFEVLASLKDQPINRYDNWLSHNFYTYTLLKAGTDPDNYAKNINKGIIEKYISPMLLQLLNISVDDFYEQGNSFEYIVTKLTDIHLESKLQYEIEPNGNKSYVIVFGALALLILIVASINFINLATARSAKRSLEVGIRKLSGSTKISLITQFLTESTILSLISLTFSVIMVALLMPAFNNLIQSSLVFNPFSSLNLILILLAVGILVGILAGLYPAIALASFRPAEVLKGNRSGYGNKGGLRKFLVIMQFAVTLVILASTVTAYRQLNYMQTKDLGFEKENVFIVGSGQFLGDEYQTFREELLKDPNILQIGRSNNLPGSIFSNNAHWLEGHGFDEIYSLMQTSVSFEWAEALGIEVVEGRFFDPEMLTDSSAVIINEATVRELNIENPLETRFYRPSGPNGGEVEYQQIIGVVKDFHFESMHQPIGPVILYPMGNRASGYICIKTSGEAVPETMQYVEQTWKTFAPDYPLESFWLEDYFDRIFTSEKQTSQILVIFSILSILISCLGLFGLISFATILRTKEIAIRKTYGSNITQIVMLLFKETYVLLIISTILALPSFILINKWMQNFTYRIDFGMVVFVFTLLGVALLTMIISAATISQEAMKAARANPSEALMQ